MRNLHEPYKKNQIFQTNPFITVQYRIQKYIMKYIFGFRFYFNTIYGDNYEEF